MTLLNYTDFVPTPAPLAAGAPFQSYIDPTNEVWVAQGGVGNGVWKRARDVIKTRVYRASAYTLATAANVIWVLDGTTRDDYGLYNNSNGLYTVPITGWYRFYAQVQAGTQAAGSYLQITLMTGAGGGFAQNTVYYYGTGVFYTVQITDLEYLSAGATYAVSVRASTAASSTVANYTDYATFEYAGTFL